MAKRQNISEAEVEKQFFETIRPTSLLKRFESTEEVASVVAFVASTQAVAINGAAVRRRHSQHFLALTTATNACTCYHPLFVLKPVLNVRRRFRLARNA